MSFIPSIVGNGPRRVEGCGPANAKIAIIGEAPGLHESIQLKPFVGQAGSVLEQCLHAAGMIRSEVYLTNVVKTRPSINSNDIAPYFNGKTFTAAGQKCVTELIDELNTVKPNVIVACGNTALAAVALQTSITKYRGYILDARPELTTRKVVPCIHPAACLWGKKPESGGLATSSVKPYLYRYVIICDLKKAKVESHFPELIRPDRKLAYNFADVNEVLDWLSYMADQPLVCFDIEVVNYELSCISFSASPDVAVSIPIAYTWTVDEESQIFRGIQKILGNEKSVKVGQNLIFDTHFLLTRCGIEVRGPIQDTMIGHSIVYPELPKGLGFIGSIYCGSQSYWKDLVKWTNIKEES